MREQETTLPNNNFLATLKPLKDGAKFTKDELLSAEVRLPIGPGVCAASLRVAMLRPPFERRARPVVVDVSKIRHSRRKDESNFTKDEILSAEVSLPIGPDVCTSSLRVAMVRPYFETCTRLVIFDVSKLCRS